MRLINKLRYCLLAAIPLAALTACSGGGGPAGAAPEVSSITLDMVPTADAAGIYIAQDDGFFAQEGLHVKLVPVNGGEYGMGDLQTGSAQLLEGNYVSFILAQIKGKFAAPDPNDPTKTKPSRPINMRMIADTSQMQTGNQVLFVMPGSKYKSVRDLAKAGATVGVNTLHNIGSVLLGSLLASNGYPLKAIKQQPEPLPFMPKLLAEHKLPAVWLPEPFATEAQQEYGAVKLADFNQGSLQNFPIGTIVGTTSWIQSHPKTVAAFLRAYNKGQQIADSSRAAVEQALLKNKVLQNPPGVVDPNAVPPTEIAATITLDTYPLVMDVPVMQRVPDAMFQFGVIPKHYNITDMIQPEPGEITK